MNSGVYIWRNAVTKMVYVGSSSDTFRRKRIHIWSLRGNCHYNKHLQSSWNKHGEEAFEFRTVIYCDPEDCIRREQHIIDYFKAVIGWDRMYNMAPSAESPSKGKKHSQETRDKMSKALMGNQYTKGHKLTQEHRAKISKGNKGKKLTQEHRAKISKAGKGHEVSQELRVRLSKAQSKILAGKRLQREKILNEPETVLIRKRMEIKYEIEAAT